MDKISLKKLVCNEIDLKAEQLIKLGNDIWREPEGGYEEVKTVQKLNSIFAEYNLPIKDKLAVTGSRADIVMKNHGPVIAVLGELDALYLPEHPEADKQNHCAHACGHNAQIVALAGIATAFAKHEIREHLAGTLALIGCPAEECKIHSRDDIKYFGGKQELIRLGVFDDVSMALMCHANTEYLIAESSNGFVMKKVRFYGSSAHAGRPWQGNNALSAARIAIAAIDAQRDTFNDEDAVRIHGIITNGGSAVNIVPEFVELDYQVRAKSIDAILSASMKFDRSIRAGAIALGVKATIQTFPGYMPVSNNRSLTQIHNENLDFIAPGNSLKHGGHRASSTDFGDITTIMPGVHPYTAGWQGVAHATDFSVNDPQKAFVEPSKMLACDIIDLMFEDAQTAKDIIAKHKPTMTRLQYLELLDSMSKTENIG